MDQISGLAVALPPIPGRGLGVPAGGSVSDPCAAMVLRAWKFDLDCTATYSTRHVWKPTVSVMLKIILLKFLVAAFSGWVIINLL